MDHPRDSRYDARHRELDCRALDSVRSGGRLAPERTAFDGRDDVLHVGAGHEVASFALADGELVPLGRPTSFDGAVLRLAVSERGRLFVVTASRRGAEVRDGRRPASPPLATYPAPPLAVAATDRHVVAILPAEDERPAVLHVVDALARRTVGTLALSDGETDVAAGRAETVIVRGGRSGHVRRLDLARLFGSAAPEACREEPPGPREQEPDSPRREPEPVHPDARCGCACPQRRPGGRLPRPVPPELCRPGSDAVDEGCWLTYAIGAQIVRIDVCGPDRPDEGPGDRCTRALFERQSRLYRTRDHLLATSADGRTLTVLDPETLGVIRQTRPRGGVGPLLASRSSTTAFMLGGEDRPLTIVETPSLAVPVIGDLQALASVRTVHGSGEVAAPPGPVAATTSLQSLLVVPVVEPGQTFSGGTNAYHAQLEEPLQVAVEYYREQTYKDVGLIYEVFGRDTPGLYSGGPVGLTKKIRSFYHPPFEPGGLRGESTQPGRVTFTGQEVHEVEVVSAVNVPDVEFGLLFPAAVYVIAIGNGLSLSIDRSGGASAYVVYTDRDGLFETLTLRASALSSDLDLEFSAADPDFGPALEDLRAAFQEMIDADPNGGDFTDVDVRWVKSGTDLGSICILLRFAPGGSARPAMGAGLGGQLPALLGLAPGTVDERVGAVSFPSGSLDNAASVLADYLDTVLLLAEAKRTDGIIVERWFGDTVVDARMSGGDLRLTVDLVVSDVHGGGGVATIRAMEHAGDDPLRIGAGAGESVIGGSVTKDASNALDDREGLFEQLYGAMTAAIEEEFGPLSDDAWEWVRGYLTAYDAIVLVPVALPPPSDPGAWSLDAEADVRGLRAGAYTGLTIADPGGLAPPITGRFLVQYLNFDERLLDDAETLAHETGHSLGLGDQYVSTKYNPQLLYLGGLDLMAGSAGGSFPHLCAYHKLALELFDEGDRRLITPPDPDTTTTRRFIVPAQEWWDPADEAAFRAAHPGEPGGTDVTPAILCDLGGDGGTLAVVEARSAREPFSVGISDRVIVTNVLDYGTKGRYGQVIPDVADVPDDVVKGLLRYRRRIHPVTVDLQPGQTFDMATAPGFPVPGLRVEVLSRGDASIGSATVPVYLVEVVWELGPHADVGFSDNDEEYRSSDLAIDWKANGTESWPVGEPVGVGEEVRIPATGTEAHEVMVRVWNFGNTPARDVRVELFLRSPGGGGDPDDDDLFDEVVIESLPPESEAGPVEVRVPWDVPSTQVDHFCWRAQVAGFELGSGANAVVISQDAKISNNWAQQNIFDADIVYASPPEPLTASFSVYNDGPFIERAFLEPVGLPRGATAIISPATLIVPPESRRRFSIRIEVDEALTRSPCARDFDVLFQCWREEEHHPEEWGASLFKLHLREKTETTVAGQWLAETLRLHGDVSPSAATGRVSLRLDFLSGEPAVWITTPLSVGGAFDEVVDTSGIEHDGLVSVTAHYEGSTVHARSSSEPVRVGQQGPAG